MMQHNESILFIHIENNKFASRFKNIFEEKGFTIIHVGDIEEAHKVLGTQAIDMIVLDMDENYRESFKFCFNIKHNKNLQHIMIIALSGANIQHGIFLEAKTKEEKEWLNVNILVHKPINARNLYLLVKKELAIIEGIDSTLLDTDNIKTF